MNLHKRTQYYFSSEERQNVSTAFKELLSHLALRNFSMDSVSDESSEIIKSFVNYKRQFCGRKSWSEMNPELVSQAKTYKAMGYTYREVAEQLFQNGFTNSKGKQFAHEQISRILKQVKNL